MKDLILKLSEELEKASKEEKSKLIDAEIERFSEYMATEVPDIRARGPLMIPEKFLLKTYLIMKLKGVLDVAL